MAESMTSHIVTQSTITLHRVELTTTSASQRSHVMKTFTATLKRSPHFAFTINYRV